MIRKFAGVPALRVVLAAMFVTTILGGAEKSPAQAPDQTQPTQQAQPQQQPDNQQSSSQEAPPEESQRHVKPRLFKNWVFNVGGGANVTGGTTRTLVRSGGGSAAAGVARNYSQYFGFRADFQWNNLPLRDSALELAQAPGATSQVYSVMIDPIINIPVTKLWGGYVVVGPSFYHRTGKLDSSAAVPGAPCNAFWTWWGACYGGGIPLSGDFLRSTENEFGENFGGGITHRIRPNLEIYAEFRIMHGSRNNTTTDLRPITLGVRW
jgi:hypothetical protein